MGYNLQIWNPATNGEKVEIWTDFLEKGTGERERIDGHLMGRSH
jgi:hypothetical protein